MRKLILLAMAIITSVLAIAQQSYPVEIEGSVGKLAARVQLPETAKDAKCHVVIVCHGFTGNMDSPLLTDLANDLVEGGIGVVRFDFNGHGKSEGKFENMTVLNEIEDLKKVIDWIKNQNFTEDISLAGHSQGGVVTSMVAGELGYPEIRSLAIMSSAAVLRDDALRGNTQGSIYDPWNVPERIPLYGGALNMGRDYVLSAQTLPIYETAENYTGPVFILHGTHDTIVPYTYSERYKSIYKNAELKLMPGQDHSYTTETEEAALLVSDFFKKALNPSPDS
ncbi:MAG: lysophospholipase [Muribaculaceae bacterium]|nr:lysophospholipase [Muribaculaceae bacterium]